MSSPSPSPSLPPVSPVWDSALNEKLRVAVYTHNSKNWNKIVTDVFGSSLSAEAVTELSTTCLQHWQAVSKTEFPDTPLTEQEEQLLTEFLKDASNGGMKNLHKLLPSLPGRLLAHLKPHAGKITGQLHHEQQPHQPVQKEKKQLLQLFHTIPRLSTEEVEALHNVVVPTYSMNNHLRSNHSGVVAGEHHAAAKQGVILNILTQNHLARVFASKKRLSFVPTEFLSWRYRRQRIQQIVEELDFPDIIAFQEVGIDEFEPPGLPDSDKLDWTRRLTDEKMSHRLAAYLEKQKKSEPKSNSSSKSSSKNNSRSVSPSVSGNTTPRSGNGHDLPPHIPTLESIASESVVQQQEQKQDSQKAEQDTEFVGGDADPVFPAMRDGDFAAFFHSNGYAWALQSMDKHKKAVPGLAIVYNRRKFYSKPHFIDSRSRTMSIGLQLRKKFLTKEEVLNLTVEQEEQERSPPSLQNLIYVADVHLQGHWSESSTRFQQVKSLTTSLAQQIEKDAKLPHKHEHVPQEEHKHHHHHDHQQQQQAHSQTAPTTTAEDSVYQHLNFLPKVFMLGDFNDHALESAVHSLLANGQAQTPPPAHVVLSQKEGAGEVTLSKNQQAIMLQQKEQKQSEPETYPVIPSPLPCQLVSGFPPIKPLTSLLQPMTFSMGNYQDILDYIYYSPCGMKLHNRLQTLGDTQLKTDQEMERIFMEGLPNATFPSDHLPVALSVELK